MNRDTNPCPMNPAFHVLPGFALVVVCMTQSLLAADAVEISPNRTVIYKSMNDIDLKLDVFEPVGFKVTDHRPAIVFFFGGGWQ